MLRKSLFLCFLAAAACGTPDYSVGTEKFRAKMAVNDAARSAGLPILVDAIGVSSPNSAGGVNFRVGYTNLSDKPIKYIRDTGRAFNAVGDTVRGDIRGSTTSSSTYTGPLKPNGSTGLLSAENAWYNSSIRCARLIRIEITYMDNTTRTFSSPSSIQPLLRPGVKDSCSVN